MSALAALWMISGLAVASFVYAAAGLIADVRMRRFGWAALGLAAVAFPVALLFALATYIGVN